MHQTRQLELLSARLQDVQEPDARVVPVENDVSAKLFDGLLVQVEELLEASELVEELQAGPAGEFVFVREDGVFRAEEEGPEVLDAGLEVLRETK